MLRTRYLSATVGIGIDRIIAKYGALSPSKALIFQAIGAERIESLCDTLQRDIASEKEKEGSVFVFRPSEAMHISRLEKDKSKLVDLYNLGRKDVNARLDALLNFLEK